mgnify:CR=1 FL=1
MIYRYSSRSRQRLRTCHPDLVLLFDAALSDPACPSDISILEGFRGRERQNEMKSTGKSQLGPLPPAGGAHQGNVGPATVRG